MHFRLLEVAVFLAVGDQQRCSHQNPQKFRHKNRELQEYRQNQHADDLKDQRPCKGDHSGNHAVVQRREKGRAEEAPVSPFFSGQS